MHGARADADVGRATCDAHRRLEQPVVVDQQAGLIGRVLERALGAKRQPEAGGAPDAGGVVEDALRRLRDLFAR